MNKKVFKFVNFSSVTGGQERYLQILFSRLTETGIKHFYTGKPSIRGAVSYDKHDNFDILVLNGNSAIYKSFKDLISKKFKVYIQHSSIDDAQGKLWKRLIRKIVLFVLLRRVELVIRVCEAALPSIYAPGKVVTIYNGVSIPEMPLEPTKQVITKLLMVGALTQNKNQALALEALTHLPSMHLTIVGDGPERRSLKAKTKELGLCERVVFIGFTEQPEKYYSQCDLLLMLSHFEAFPLVLLEAMARYCPVLSVKVGGVPEVLEHKFNGWLMDGYCPQTLAAEIKAINADITGYNNVAQSARKTIEAGFTEQHMVDKLLTEINKRYK